MNLQTFRRWMDEANAKHFEGKVKLEVATYSRKSRTMGFYRVRNKIPTIHVNLIGQRTEAEHKAVLLHEMVHAYLHALGLPRGHTPYFKRIMTRIYQAEFNFTPKTNVRFVVAIPTTPPVIVLPAAPKAPLFRVLSNGLVGELLRETVAFGRKMIVLRVEGNLFPFETELANVQKLA